jgi:hypothetical protein
MGIGDWGLGIGDWAIPNPQIFLFFYIILLKFILSKVSFKLLIK